MLHSESLLRFLLLASTSDIRPESLPDSRSQTSRKSVTIFPVSAYWEKVKITNHNNNNKDNPVCKRSSCCLCGHQHMPLQYKKKISVTKTVCELRFCVKKTTIVILLLYSQKSFLCRVLACVASHRSRQKKPLHFAN